MRKFLLALLVSLLLAGPALGMSKRALNKLKDKEHRSMHEIIIVDRDADGKIVGGGLCTAYATGPHTLLTAAHCNDEYANAVYIDADRDAVHANQAMSYKFSRQFDHEDHMILDVSGVYFADYVPLSANVPVPKQRDHTYFWGNPSGITDQYREPVVMGSMPFNQKTDDPDIDVTGNVVYLLTGPAVPGDSGSSIFNSKGERIAILTYGFDNGAVIGAFPIQFTQEQIGKSLQEAVPDVPLVRPPSGPGYDGSVFPFGRPLALSFSQHGHGNGSHSAPRGNNHSAPNRGPRGGYHGNGPAHEHWHNGRFDHDYYVAHFGMYHPFYAYDLFWYGPAYWEQSIFVFDDCGFVVLVDVPVYMRGVPVYVVELDGSYFLTSTMYPTTFVALTVAF